MRPCRECPKEAVLSNGIDLCQDHLWQYDSPIIYGMLELDNSKLKELFLIHSFKTVYPTFSLFPLLYEKYPQVKRGKWSGIEKGFEKSQKQYLNECFEKFLKEKLHE